MNREQRLADTFVALADTLVENFDVIEFLQDLADRCAELLDVSAAALMFALPGAELRPAATTDSGIAMSDLLAALSSEGPGGQCYRSGGQVVADAAELARRWPQLAEQARTAGYPTICALPLRLRQEVIGCMLLLRTEPTPPPRDDIRLAQALADAAAIGILHQRGAVRSTVLASQLHTALHSRIAVEQAKGVLATRWGVGVDEAFQALRSHARHHRLPLSDIARQVVDGTLLPDRPPVR